MTVCGNRTDDPGFFTACGTCVCCSQVKAEILAAQQAQPPSTSETVDPR